MQGPKQSKSRWRIWMGTTGLLIQSFIDYISGYTTFEMISVNELDVHIVQVIYYNLTVRSWQ